MPNRVLKEKFWADPLYDSLTPEEEAFFLRLLTAGDDYGRAEATLALLQSRLYPLRAGRMTPVEVWRLLRRLQARGLLRLYAADGRVYAPVRAQRSRHPDPEDGVPLPSHEAETEDIPDLLGRSVAYGGRRWPG